MLALLVLPILIAGFVLCHLHPVDKYKLQRYEGRYLYLKSAKWGMLCFVIALLLSVLTYVIAHVHWAVALACVLVFILAIVCCCIYRDSIKFKLCFCVVLVMVLISLWLFTPANHQWIVCRLATVIGDNGDGNYLDEAQQTLWFIVLSFMTLLMPFCLAEISKARLQAQFGSHYKLAVMRYILQDSPLDDLLLNLALDPNKFVMLSMNDRKVYVGKMISLGEPASPSENAQDISIMPIMSGYRAGKTLKVILTTLYSEALFTLPAPNWLNFNSDNYPARGRI